MPKSHKCKCTPEQAAAAEFYMEIVSLLTDPGFDSPEALSNYYGQILVYVRRKTKEAQKNEAKK